MDNIWNNENLIKVLNSGGVVVMPTDTIYGIVCSALNESAVNRVYNIRKRAPDKPCIVLISDISELEKFSINISDEQRKEIGKYWSFDQAQDFQPGPVSIILDCTNDSFSYLHRGTNTLALRLPAQIYLRQLLKETGPLIAPSANIEGLLPASNIMKAKEYFNSQVNLYIDGGDISSRVSKVIKLHKDGSVSILRE